MNSSPIVPRTGAESNPYPETLPPRPENIPEELKALPQWVVWRWVFDAARGEWTKPPFDPKTGRRASHSDSNTWSDFETAIAAYGSGGFDGIGFVLTENDPYTAWDWDKSRDPQTGLIRPFVRRCLARLQGYAETSPSGSGIRVIVKARLPEGRRRRSRFEVYDRLRYITLTGHTLEPVLTEIPNRQAEVEALHAELFGPDGKLIEEIFTGKHGEELARLWDGDTGDYDHDESRADLALCNRLRGLVGADPARIDRLFRLSCLYRRKWDEVHSGDGRTYGEMTIEKALAESSSDATGDEPPRVLQVIDALDIPDPGPTRWVIQGVLPEGYLLLLAGRPKMGKTTLLISLIAAVAAGLAFADLPTGRRKVLALLAEDDEADVRRALEAAGLRTRGQVLLLTLDGALPRWEDLARTALERGCGVVIVDPQALLNRFRPGAAGYEDTYAALYEARRVLRQAGLAAITTTHVAKGKSVIREITDVIDAPLGTTAYSAVADGVAAFGQHPQNSELRRLLGHGRKRVSFDLAFEFADGLYRPASATGVLSPLAREIYDTMRLQPSRGWTARQIREAFGRNNVDVQAALQQLREQGLVQFEKEGSRVLWHLPYSFTLSQ